MGFIFESWLASSGNGEGIAVGQSDSAAAVWRYLAETIAWLGLSRATATASQC
jgi:hypothetical protein